MLVVEQIGGCVGERRPIDERRRVQGTEIEGQRLDSRLDVEEGNRPIALAFHDPVRTNYAQLKEFVEGIKLALPNMTAKGTPLVLIFDTDIANSVGNVMIRETGIENILSIDEIELKEGDFIDVGEPMTDESIYPIVIKSLIFSG